MTTAYKLIKRYTIGTTPQLIAPQGDNANNLRSRCYFYNNDSVPIYLDNSPSMTSANGYPLLPGVEAKDKITTDAWYAVVASGTADLRTLVIFG